MQKKKGKVITVVLDSKPWKKLYQDKLKHCSVISKD